MSHKKSVPVLDLLKYFILVIVMGVAVALVYSATADRIDQNILRKNNEAKYSVFPSASDFKEISVPAGFDRIVKAYRVGNAGADIGLCFEVESYGFGGAIRMIIGVSYDGAVTGIVPLDNSETIGIGTNVLDGAYISSFIGIKDKTISEIDTVSGATKTSAAVLEGVRESLKCAAIIYKGN